MGGGAAYLPRRRSTSRGRSPRGRRSRRPDSQQSVTPKWRPGALASALAAVLLAGGSGLAFQQFLPYQAPDVAEVARQTEQRRLAIVEAERLWPTVKDSTSIATLEAFLGISSTVQDQQFHFGSPQR